MIRTRRTAFAALAMGLLLATGARPAAAEVLIRADATWQYWDKSAPPPGDPSQAGYDASAWKEGAAPLGYGESDVVTTLSFGPDEDNKHTTCWFRATFQLGDASAFDALEANMRYDDGIVVHLNGVEVIRENMPAGPIDPTTFALGGHEPDAEDVVFDPDALVDGENVIVVELHQRNLTTTDALWAATFSATQLGVVRGPYLQRATPTSMVVRWRTNLPTDSAVTLTDPGGPIVATDPAAVIDHNVLVSGLTAETTYTYIYGTMAEALGGGDDLHTFTTPPVAGSSQRIRTWVLGDSGTGTATAAAVRDAYANFSPDTPTDVWLMLGDNAYNNGTDAEYQNGVFDMYPDVLKRVPLWSTLGNHDARSAASATQTGIYYDLFSFPTAGEAGGVASGTEAYYSFDHASAHFVSLNSQDVDRSPSGAMATWLHDDLSSNTLPFTVVFFHHPPYTKGSHDSDTESRHIDMRQNIVPILEQYSVDIVLSGHSHAYERSYLIAGHYGFSDALQSDMVLDDGTGEPGAPYVKNVSGNPGHDGTLYVVAGASSKSGGGSFDHPVMHISVATRGSLILDIDNTSMTGHYLTEDETVLDTFVLEKEDRPVSIVGGDRSAKEGEAMSLSAAGMDVDQDLIWSFSDGSADKFGRNITHAFRDDGVYTVTATSSTSSDIVNITVANIAPRIVSAQAEPGDEGAPVWLAAEITDPGVLDTLTAFWTFADGTVRDGLAVEHVFANDGDNMVTFTALDDDGGTVSVEVIAQTANLPPTVSIDTPDVVVAGTFFTTTLITDDPGVNDVLTVSTAFGDGTSATGLSPLHAYAASGEYTLVATVTDDAGATAEMSRPLTVAPAEPGMPVGGATLAVPATAKEAQTIAMATSAPVGSTVTWSFGDGEQAIGRSATHRYADDGSYVVSASISAPDVPAPVVLSATIVITDVAPRLVSAPPAPLTRPFAYTPVVDAADTDVLSFRLEPRPAGVDFDPERGALTLVDEPASASHFLALTVVDDDGSEHTQTVQIDALSGRPPPLGGVLTQPAEPASRASCNAGGGLASPLGLLAAGLAAFTRRRSSKSKSRRRRT